MYIAERGRKCSPSFFHYHRPVETGLEIITTAKISNKFSKESPYISNTFSRESPRFQTGFHLRKRGPCHSKEWTGKPSKSGDLNILVSGITKYDVRREGEGSHLSLKVTYTWHQFSQVTRLCTKGYSRMTRAFKICTTLVIFCIMK